MTTKPKGNPIHVISMGKEASVRLAGYSILLLFIASGIFSSITKDNGSVNSSWLALITYLATLVVHELVHGAAFRLFGGKVKYGVGVASYIVPYAYATAPRQAFTLIEMIVVGLSPFIIICAVAIAVAIIFPLTIPFASIVFVGNFAGAVGDLWLMGQILKFRKVGNLQIVDEKSGMALYASGAIASRIAKNVDEAELKSRSVNRFIAIWITASAALIILAVSTPVLLAIIGYHGHFLIGPSPFPLVDVQNGSESSSFTLNPVPGILAGFVYALLRVWIFRPHK